MIKKYDWILLKNEFISATMLSVAEFLRERQIKYNSYTRKRTRGWSDERTAYQKKTIQQAHEQNFRHEVGIRQRQLQLSQRLQLKGLKSLEHSSVATVEDARRMIVSGLKAEQEAIQLGKYDNDEKPSHLPSSKLEFDTLIDKMTYDEVMAVLAQLESIGHGR